MKVKPSGPYTAIYADPPWPYDNPVSNDPAMGGKTYAVMSLDDICSVPVISLAAPDCALFLWVPMPKLPQGLQVMAEWGFRYTTCAFVWVKSNPNGEGVYSGLGHWTNQNAELCLLGKIGRPQRVSKCVKQIVQSPRGRHSAKPSEVRERIVNLLGDVPRIELFAREKVSGWEALGLEIDGKDIFDAIPEHLASLR